MIVIGLDQSTGTRSNFGYAVVDLDKMEILRASEFVVEKARTLDSQALRKRIKHLAATVMQEIKTDQKRFGSIDYIFLEGFVMAGKGGESLQRLVGAIMLITPNEIPVDFAHNLQTKMFITGSGKAEKHEVAEGLKKFFPKSRLLIDLIDSKRYDALDAIAIALAGAEKHIKKTRLSNNEKKGNKKTTSNITKKSL